MKIIVDINEIYTGNMLEIKDWILAFDSIGIDGVTIDVGRNKDGEKRVTERELYILKAYCDLAKIELYPEVEMHEILIKNIGIENYIHRGVTGQRTLVVKNESNFLYIINKLPLYWMNYVGVIDNIKGITASIIAICKGVRYIVKGINSEESAVPHFVNLNKLKELCEFRDEYKKVMGIKI